METSRARNGREAIPKKILTYNPPLQKKKEKHRTPTDEVEGPAQYSRGRNRPRMA
jgi:hypothetical protein